MCKNLTHFEEKSIVIEGFQKVFQDYKKKNVLIKSSKVKIPYESSLGFEGEVKFLIGIDWWREWCDYVNFINEINLELTNDKFSRESSLRSNVMY